MLEEFKLNEVREKERIKRMRELRNKSKGWKNNLDRMKQTTFETAKKRREGLEMQISDRNANTQKLLNKKKIERGELKQKKIEEMVKKDKEAKEKVVEYFKTVEKRRLEEEKRTLEKCNIIIITKKKFSKKIF
jgi:hypothetical protein